MRWWKRRKENCDVSPALRASPAGFGELDDVPDRPVHRFGDLGGSGFGGFAGRVFLKVSISRCRAGLCMARRGVDR
jgi:hypothetical protein